MAIVITRMDTKRNSTTTLPSSRPRSAPRDTCDGLREEVVEGGPRDRPDSGDEAGSHECDEHPPRHIPTVINFVAAREPLHQVTHRSSFPKNLLFTGPIESWSVPGTPQKRRSPEESGRSPAPSWRSLAFRLLPSERAGPRISRLVPALAGRPRVVCRARPPSPLHRQTSATAPPRCLSLTHISEP